MKAALERSGELKRKMQATEAAITLMEGERDKATDQKSYLDMDNKIKANRKQIQEQMQEMKDKDMLWEKLDSDKRNFTKHKAEEKKRGEEKQAKEDAVKFDQDFEKAEKEVYEKDEEWKNKKWALDELKHKIDLEEDATKKANMEATYKTDEAAYNTLDELVTARKDKWTKMQTQRTERDNKKKSGLAAKKKALADNVEAAKG